MPPSDLIGYIEISMQAPEIGLTQPKGKQVGDETRATSKEHSCSGEVSIPRLPGVEVSEDEANLKLASYPGRAGKKEAWVRG